MTTIMRRIAWIRQTFNEICNNIQITIAFMVVISFRTVNFYEMLKLKYFCQWQITMLLKNANECSQMVSRNAEKTYQNQEIWLTSSFKVVSFKLK